jgi:DNA-directed RNA polymerase specialized sigma subunit
MAKVGRVLRISESRVCQIHTQSIALLREIVKPESLAS